MKARGAQKRRGKACPVCDRPMAEVSVPVKQEPVLLDVCAGCQFVWFDPREFEQFSKPPRKPTQRERLPEKAREAIAMAELKHEAEVARGADFGDEAPDEPWKHIPAFFGMPVEHEVNPIRNWPLVTWGLSAIIVLMFAFTFANLGQVVQNFGLVPAQPWRHGGVTFVTSFFLHAGLFHVISNVYFLLIFGDNVEDHLGPWRYWMLLAAATLAGDLLHIAGEPRAMIPCVGASGGISGVIAFYALKFPRARLGFMIRYWAVFKWFYIPAWCALILWLLLQFLLASFQLAGMSSVSALAHLGGAGVGVGAWLLWREAPYVSEQSAESS